MRKIRISKEKYADRIVSNMDLDALCSIAKTHILKILNTKKGRAEMLDFYELEDNEVLEK